MTVNHLTPLTSVLVIGIVLAIGVGILALGLCRAADKPAPVREFETSPYGPLRAGLVCNAHRPHVMGSTTDGRWICTRCQQVWQPAVFDQDAPSVVAEAERILREESA